MRFVWVGVGGALGSMLRYAVGLALAGSAFPLGTLLVNITGSFAIGLVYSAFLGRWPVSVMTAVTVGVLGGFTTFSTFAWESLSAAKDDRVGMAAVYVFASIVGGMLAAWLGYLSGRAISS